MLVSCSLNFKCNWTETEKQHFRVTCFDMSAFYTLMWTSKVKYFPSFSWLDGILRNHGLTKSAESFIISEDQWPLCIFLAYAIIIIRETKFICLFYYWLFVFCCQVLFKPKISFKIMHITQVKNNCLKKLTLNIKKFIFTTLK